MADIEDDRTTTSAVPSQASTWIGGAGLLLIALGLSAAVMLIAEMAGDDLGDTTYTAVEKWLAILTAAIVTGLGVIAVGIATAVGRMPERRD